jgi:hypothetical protein
MNLPIQPSPPRVPSPISQAEMTNPTEADPTPHQPETHEPLITALASPSLEVSALPGASPSPVIAPAQETSYEVSICA